MPDLPNGNQFANVTIPGLAGALTAFLFFLPPHPINAIPVVDLSSYTKLPVHLSDKPWRTLLKPGMLSTFKGATGCRGESSGKNPSQDATAPSPPKCVVEEYQLVDEPQFPPFHRGESQTLQVFLEEQRVSLQECLALEQSDAGKEKTDNDADARELSTLENARDSSRALTRQFEDFHSLLTPIVSARTATIEAEIQKVRNNVAAREQHVRARDYEIAAFTRFSAWLDARLADPSRLRPEQSLGDYLKALSDHVAAFIALAAGVGTIFKVLLSPLGSMGLFRVFFKEEM